VTNRWLAESCSRKPSDGDEDDRKLFKNGPTLQN
jgi:hypothetical protein